LHSLRHTLNTILIQRGVPEGVIRAALGWSDPKIQARYTHIDTFGRSYRSPLVDSVVDAIMGRQAKAKRGKAG
jgi:integrase